jgi:hypothetical protein
MMQQDNDPKHRSKSTTECLQQNNICLLEWPSQSRGPQPDWDAVAGPQESGSHQTPKNIAKLKQFCKKEWYKIPPDRCAGLICNYRKRWGDCCQSRVNNLLKPRVHKLSKKRNVLSLSTVFIISKLNMCK